jgi:toxin ParE1/3/4
MSKYHLTNKAVDDLAGIWEYTFDKWSKNQADRYYLILIESFNEITIKPQIGKPYLGIVENLKGYQVGKHIVFYRLIENNNVEIIRILHERMDLKNRIIEK